MLRSLVGSEMCIRDRVVVEPEVWVDAVVEAGQLGFAQGIAWILGLLFTAALIASLIFFALRRHWRGAAISATTLAVLVFVIGANQTGGPSGTSLLLVIVGLALAWFSYRMDSDQPLANRKVVDASTGDMAEDLTE